MNDTVPTAGEMRDAIRADTAQHGRMPTWAEGIPVTPLREEPRLYELATDLTAPPHRHGFGPTCTGADCADQGVPVPAPSEPDPYTTLAAELRRIADNIAVLADCGLVNQHVTLRFYPWGKTDADNVTAIDAIGEALLDKPGAPSRMSNGTYHYEVKGQRGPVEIEAFQAIEAPERRELVDELAGLRAQVEAARAELAAVKGGSS